jgi:uncharacterized protein (TIGR02118 family)
LTRLIETVRGQPGKWTAALEAGVVDHLLTRHAMAVKITITFGPPADPDAFERHYVSTHAPLVRVLPGLRGYEYGRALANFDGSPPEAFWVVSLSFDDADAMRSAFASPAGQKTVEDMPKFITGTMTSVVSEVRGSDS